MFIEAVFTVAKTWKHLNAHQQINKVWCIHTMEYYSAIEKNEIGSFVETWMDLETVVQSEASQKEKNIEYRHI